VCAALVALASLACTPTDFVFVAGGGGSSGPGGSATSAGGAGGAGGTGAAPPSFQLEDPLDGSGVGNPIGGSFGPAGWTVTAKTDRIWYALPRLVEGAIEVTVSEMPLANMTLVDHELCTMYEAGYGIAEPINYNPEFRNNHYKVMLRAHGTAAVGSEGRESLVWRMCPSGAPGYDACTCTEYIAEPTAGDGSWDGSPQRLRLEWGDGQTRYWRNDTLVHSLTWNERVFAPEQLHFSIGSSRSVDIGEAGLPIGAVFSDLSIQGNEGDVATCL
jgi:hypothetical protein